METKKIAVIILIILAFGAAGYYLYTQNNNSKSKNSLVAVTSSPTPPISKSSDSDKDGLSDSIEKVLGTNINNLDTDSDTYSDLEEIKNGYSPLIAGSTKLSVEEWQIFKDKIKAIDKDFYEKNFEIVSAPFPTSSPTTTSFNCGTYIVKDIDSNIYNTVKIGEQCWLKENLKVTKNPTGQAITRYCYDNDQKICDTDGGLYDWNTTMNGSIVEGAQGICPNGWHVPKDSEWYVLENGLKDEGKSCDANRIWSGCETAGSKLKIGGNSGFDALPAGLRNYSGVFNNRGSGAVGLFWSSLDSGDNAAWNRSLSWLNDTVVRYKYVKTIGFSVRCLKD